MTDLEKIDQLQKELWKYEQAKVEIKKTMNNLQKDSHYSYVCEGLSIALDILESVGD